jgi:hypothetical protein
VGAEDEEAHIIMSRFTFAVINITTTDIIIITITNTTTIITLYTYRRQTSLRAARAQAVILHNSFLMCYYLYSQQPVSFHVNAPT